MINIYLSIPIIYGLIQCPLDSINQKSRERLLSVFTKCINISTGFFSTMMHLLSENYLVDNLSSLKNVAQFSKLPELGTLVLDTHNPLWTLLI